MFNFKSARVVALLTLFALALAIASIGGLHLQSSATHADGGEWIELGDWDLGNSNVHAVKADDIALVVYHPNERPGYAPQPRQGYAWDKKGRGFYIDSPEMYELVKKAMAQNSAVFSSRGDIVDGNFYWTIDAEYARKITQLEPHEVGQVVELRTGRWTVANEKRKRNRTEIVMDFDWRRHGDKWPHKIILEASLDETVAGLGGGTSATQAEGGEWIKLGDWGWDNSNVHAVKSDDIALAVWFPNEEGGYDPEPRQGYAWDKKGRGFHIDNTEMYKLVQKAMAQNSAVITSRGDIADYHFNWTIDAEYVRKITQLDPHKVGQRVYARNTASLVIKPSHNRNRTKIVMDFDWRRHGDKWPDKVIVRTSLDKMVAGLGGGTE